MADEEKEKQTPPREEEQAYVDEEEVEQSDAPLEKMVADKIFSYSEAGETGLVQQLEEHKRPYVAVKVIQQQDRYVLIIEAHRSFNIKEILKANGFRWNKKRKLWEKAPEQPMTEEEFKRTLMNIAPSVDAIIVSDRVKNRVERMFVQKAVAEMKNEAPVVEKTQPNPAVEEKAPEPEQTQERTTATAEEDNPTPEIDENKIKIDTSSIPQPAQQSETQEYIMTYKILRNMTRNIQRAMEKAMDDIAKVLNGELVYLHYNRFNQKLTIIVNNAYTKKNQLKALNYRYNGLAKTWEKEIDPNDYDREIEQLFEKVGVGLIIPVGMTPENAKEEAKKVKQQYHGKYHKRGYGSRGREYQKEAGV